MIAWWWALMACGGCPDATESAASPEDVAPPTPVHRVWIDADPSVGVPDRDVDDGLALLQAIASPELDIQGISTVFGNASLEQTDRITRELVTAWAPDLPVHTGAAKRSREPTAASEALIAALERQPMAVLALGPATNVATVLRQRPNLAPRMRPVIAVAGRRPGQRFLTGTAPRAHRDFNFEQDPSAFQVLLDAGIDLVLAPWEVSSKVWVRGPDLDALQDHPRAGRLVPPARGWLDLWTRTFEVDGFNPFDTLAVGWLVRPELLSCSAGVAHIERAPDDRTEATLADAESHKPYLVVARPVDGAAGQPVVYCEDVKGQAFTADLLQRLTR